MTTIFLHGFSGDGASLAPFVEAVGFDTSYAIDLPGFGNNKRQYEPSWEGYVTATMATIQEVAGAGPYRLIGHSHGAMVAYALVQQYPDDIKYVTLICPVASSTILGKSFMHVNRVMRRVLGDHRTLQIHKKQFVVDTVTRLGVQSDWPEGAHKRIRNIRREESTRYDAEMLDVLKLVPLFKKTYENTHISMSACILFAHDDLLVSKNDRDWYNTHIDITHQAWCRGGHVAPVIFPEEVASIIHYQV